MMKNILVLSAMVISVSMASASETRFGSQCGLTDASDDDAIIEVGKGTNLSKGTRVDTAHLDLLVKQQLIIAAKNLYAEIEVRNALEAIELFRNDSEAGDLYVSDFRVGHRYFSQVVYYPGGNPVGVIFKMGTRRVVAFIGDSNIICK